jgi:hypothetical protein
MLEVLVRNHIMSKMPFTLGTRDMNHSFETRCPREECEGTVEITITYFSLGHSDDPPESDKIEWEISAPCEECGFKNSDEVSMTEYDHITHKAFEEMDDLREAGDDYKYDEWKDRQLFGDYT